MSDFLWWVGEKIFCTLVAGLVIFLMIGLLIAIGPINLIVGFMVIGFTIQWLKYTWPLYLFIAILVLSHL
jgi:hypothetical protein